MAQIGLTLDFSGYTGDLIVVWYKATAPLSEVGRSPAMPFPVSQVLQVPNLDSETYIFKFYQSSDGLQLTTLLRSWSIDASSMGDVAIQKFQYMTDRGQSGSSPAWADPVDGATQINDARLIGAGQDEIEFYTEGKGQRIDADFQMLSTGGIRLTDPLEKFSSGQTIFVTRFLKVTATPTASGSGDYTQVVTITGNTLFDAAHKNKMIHCTAPGAVSTYTLPSLGSMPACKLAFSTHGMSGNYLTIKLTAPDTIWFKGAQRSKIHLGRGEELILIKTAEGLFVLPGSDTGYDRVGKRELVDAVGLNQRVLDGGTEYLIDEYPRIAEYIAALPAYMVFTSFLDWNTPHNRHKFLYNPSAVPGVFRLPDDRGMHYRALAATDGTADTSRYGTDGTLGGPNSGNPGTYQPDQFKAHGHKMITGGWNGGSADPGRSIPRGSYNGDPYDSYGGGASSLGPYIEVVGGTETNGKTVGEWPAMNI